MIIEYRRLYVHPKSIVLGKNELLLWQAQAYWCILTLSKAFHTFLMALTSLS